MIKTDHEFFQKIFDNLLDGVIVADLDGNFIVFNQIAEKILGIGSVNIPPREWASIYGCYKTDMVTPYQVDELPLSRAFQGITVFDEVMFIKNAAQPRGLWISITAYPIRGDTGSVIAGAITFKDITYSINALEKVPGPGLNFFGKIDIGTNFEDNGGIRGFSEFGAKYNLLASVVQETDDSILITDIQGSIIYVNSGFEKQTGYSRSEILGRTPRILKSGYHDEAFYDSLWQEIKNGRHFRGTIQNKKKDGSLYWSEQTITPIKNNLGKTQYYVSVLKDITDLIERQRLEREIELAAEIQLSVLPETLPSLPGFNIEARIKPARTVSGDFFDIFPISDKKLGILIGDVVDKGMPAAISMARVHALIASGASRLDSPKEILREVNSQLFHQNKNSQFTTVLYGILDSEAMEFEYARAGHETPILLKPDGYVDVVDHQLGMALGIANDIAVDERVISIQAGTSLLLYTDGVIDCQNKDGNFFGLNGIESSLKNSGGLTAGGICDRLMRSLDEYQQDAEQYDDIALVALQANA